jgi:thiamine biosynthesis protein ThiS
MRVTINGETHHLEPGVSLGRLLEQFQLDSDKVAIEHNLHIIPAASCHNVWVNEGDRIEIVHFMGGG